MDSSSTGAVGTSGKHLCCEISDTTDSEVSLHHRMYTHPFQEFLCFLFTYDGSYIIRCDYVSPFWGSLNK